MTIRRFAVPALIALFLLLPGPAATAPAGDRLLRPAGAVLVPEHFLRQWDPVTVFFDREAGPAGGGPEDHPERLLTQTPPHPGAFTWLDGHTLQFRPAVAWPPMGRFTWTVEGRPSDLVTLMSAPVATQPADGAAGLEPVETITLRFRDPVAVDTLSQLITLELRPLPGVSGEPQRRLDFHDFEVRALERGQPSDPAVYVVALLHPIPWGTRIIVHLRLSPERGEGAEKQRLSFSTAEPFHVTRFGCRGLGYPALTEGVAYGPERHLECPAEERSVVVSFSDRLAPVGPIEGRDLIRFSPQVDGLGFKTVDNTLVVTGAFAADTLYQVRLEPASLKDTKGRPLVQGGPSQLYLSFPGLPGFLRWQKGDGIAERFGPQMVPARGRSVERVDLRIHAVDPLDRGLWPFPEKGIDVDETVQPPAPGEQPPPWRWSTDPGRDDIAARIRAFGSPSLSELVSLPVGKADATASFGVDLRPALARIAGAGRPGHYLIGIRRLDAKPVRQWMRLQVTDLSLTAVDETDHVRFAVTSLATGLPVPGAAVTVEAVIDGALKTIGSGISGSDGLIDWQAPGPPTANRASIRRVVVSKDGDLLVLDAAHPPRAYAEGGWRDDDGETAPSKGWLAWTLADLAPRAAAQKSLCHIFTERPIYRPDDFVHIKGYVRRYRDGRLDIADLPGSLVVEGPGGAEWRWPLDLNEYGSFYHKFDDKTVATGEYKAYVEFGGKEAGPARPADQTDDPAPVPDTDTSAAERPAVRHCHFVRFKKEAYRLPRFEVQMQAPLVAALDAAFPVGLTTEYYAGGVVAGRPLHWRVSQVPYTWVPKARPGFVFSVDQRFSGNLPFRSSPVLERDDKTDEHGAARLTLDPTIEPTAQPRKYLVEATVVGDDDQTVTNSQEILALPPFVLGLKVPRFLENASRIEPEVLLEDAQGKAVAGQPVTVRLIRRQWNSILQASDFTQGSAKYITEVIEDTVAETTLTSGTAPARLAFPIQGAAVYVVEVESQDRLGRLQTVKVDLFAGGERPATWSRPPAEVFAIAADKDAYAPGETAKLVLQSPFQTGQALAVIEQPDGHNHYEWVPVSKGYGTLLMPVKAEYLPRVAVHFVLMRGRIEGDDGQAAVHADLRKPATLAATEWVTVTPARNIVKVDLAYPRKAMPGQEVELTVRLGDERGQPLAGEVTLWMVDQAVLALAREARLDPLPQFIVPRPSVTRLRDSRNMAFGLLPLQEEPGGDEGDEGSPLLRATVRKNFTPVPYYEPSLRIGPEGTATVKVRLPDSLTNFKLRAKAVSGPDRFGVGTGDMHVRLPLIVQPALPRFVRPGDSLELAAVGRVVEGDGGAGRARITVAGLELTGPAERPVTWVAGQARRLDFPARVPTPAAGPDGRALRDHVEVTVAVERTADGVRDAVQVSLPLQPDRDPVTARTLAPLIAGQPVTLAAMSEPARPGSLRRELLIAPPLFATLAGGFEALVRYPFGCTEQRISQARANIAALGLGAALSGSTGIRQVSVSVQATQAWIAQAFDDNGLVAYWPGDRGYVTVTAWALHLLVEAKAAGLPVDQALRDRLVQSLRQSLRSDFRFFIDGQSWAERTWALAALTAAGAGDSAYAAELARKAPFLSLESRAQVAVVLARSPATPPATLAEVLKTLWSGVIIRREQGQEVYGGLQESVGAGGTGLILSSEVRTLAQILRAGQAVAPADPRNRLLTEALLHLGGSGGWGSTNADAEALLALTAVLSGAGAQPARTLALAFGEDRRSVVLGKGAPATLLAVPTGAGTVALGEAAGPPLAVLVRSSYLPLADGSTAAASARGFAVDRTLAVVAGDGAALRRIALDRPAAPVALAVGEVVEDHVVVANAADRSHVAVILPLAAGLEPLNPHLGTAPPEARPSEPPTLAPGFTAFLDDRVMFVYDQLPKGTYHFRIRSRATVPGRFIQPPAVARALYDDAAIGSGNGALVTVTRGAD
ncbi:MAG: alpha-2-macroglobulin family protein [Rhodospirillaceae bacterium]